MQLNTTSAKLSSRENALLAYVADLELEVDRLRKQAQVAYEYSADAIRQILPLCAARQDSEAEIKTLASVEEVTRQLASTLSDLREPPGYHPALDQVVAIAIRPLVEQVFRWQQRVFNVPFVALKLELDSEHMEWFPARLRHILDNLLANALASLPSSQGASYVSLRLQTLPKFYQLCIADHGIEQNPAERSRASELFHRSSPARSAALQVGIPVAKALVERSGGELLEASDECMGRSIAIRLPRFDISDFLT